MIKKKVRVKTQKGTLNQKKKCESKKKGSSTEFRSSSNIKHLEKDEYGSK